MTSTPDPKTIALRRALMGIDELQRRLDAYHQAEREPIAIVGMGCRFPGGADSPKAFWDLLRRGEDAIVEVPAERWKVDDSYDPRPEAPGKTYSRWGGFLQEVDRFDAAFFGIAPREANRMDPQQRLLLEVAWEALENAGIVPASLARSATGVFVGTSVSDYGILQYSNPYIVDTYSATGTALTIIPNRLSHVLDLHGPSVALDTGCSASLVAVHDACRSLRVKECDCALACGVNVILTPGITIALAKLNALSPDGRCKSFDASANGFVRSEGCGVLVLKRLSDALASKDPIVALIRGSAVYNEGRSNGLTAPSAPVQEAMLRKALVHAGVDASDVSYIEAHGTGTILGDPIEVEALAPVYGVHRKDGVGCLLGSVKANIGHLEPAAGIAGIIKAALCLQNRAVVPTVHFRSLNPHISIQGTRLEIAREYQSWPPQDVPFFAAVSSFGIGGTIGHAILQEAPRHPFQAPAEISVQGQLASTPAYILPLSARDPAALRTLAESFHSELTQGGLSAENVADICYSASARRQHHEHRLAVVGETTRALADALAIFVRQDNRPGVSYGQCQPDEARRPVFVFNGHGSQWIGMARSLLESAPAFREVIEQCDRAMERETGWRLRAELEADEAGSRLDDIDVAQRVIFSMQVALAAQWRAFGVEPAVVVGHSLGEVAAAHVAGILSLDDAVQIICTRSRAIVEHGGDPGGLLAVEMTLKDAERLVARYNDDLVIGVINGPASIVLSGREETLSDVQTRLHAKGTFCRRVRIRFASHSPLMMPAAEAMRRELRDIQPQNALIPFLSTVTGRFEQGARLNADYWARNLSERVEFAASIQTLAKNGYQAFLEIGGHPVLLHPIGDNLTHAGSEGIVIATMMRGRADRSRLLEALGEIYCAGCPVNFERLYAENPTHFVPIPTYPFQRRRYWLPKILSETLRPMGGRAQSTHPIFRLGVGLPCSLNDGAHLWHFDLDAEIVPYLADHTVRHMIVVPAAMYLEVAVAAAREIFDSGMIQLYDVTFVEALVLPKDAPRTMQVTLSRGSALGAEFGISTLETADRTWTVHSKGWIRILENASETAPQMDEPLAAVRERCRIEVLKEEHYRRAALHGIHYGPTFQGIEMAWHGDGEALAQIQWPDELTTDNEAYACHPALLDACLQTMLGVASATFDGSNDSTWVPVAVQSFQVWAPFRPEQALWAYARRVDVESPPADTVLSDVLVVDDGGKLFVEARGIALRNVDSGVQERPEDWIYNVAWQEQPATGHKPAVTGTWLILADSGDTGRMLQRSMTEQGVECIVVYRGDKLRQVEPRSLTLDPTHPEHFHGLFDLLQTAEHPQLQGIIHCWGLNERLSVGDQHQTPDRIEHAGCISTLYLIQALVARTEDSLPRLWLVTSGAQHVRQGDDVPSVAQGALWGLGRTLSLEHPELRCTCVDLEGADPRDQAEDLFGVLWHDEREHEIALRGKRRFVPRLVPRAVSATSKAAPPITMKSGQDAFRLELSQPGLLELSLVASRRREPGPGEVEIAVRAAGLNFRDVLKALGQYPGVSQGELPLGDECAGVVTAVGDGVGDRLKVGDEVIAMASGRAFSSFVIARADQVVVKPRFITFEQAATIPVAFLTAWFALAEQAKLRSGERVLIHAAAGGVGLAALQIAQELGAQVYATAGSPEKRAHLHALGVEHVFDSRSLAFVQGVQNATNGQGVDVVLNSLAGDFIPASLSLLRPFGRFIEIGKKDVYANTRLGLRPFQRNLSLTMLDLELIARERPSRFAEIFRDVMQRFADKRFSPICRHVFPISRATEALRWMGHAKHIGKIALSFDEAEVSVCAAQGGEVVFRPDATYLITGGLGGLGLVVARWMVEHGATHLVLMSRHASDKAQDAVAALAGAGVQVRVECGDVAVLEDVQRVFATIDASMPPLRGVVHAAGVLEDTTLLNMDRARFEAVLRPKLAGAIHLHHLTLDRRLDHWVLFSSVAGLFGAPGQGNYAAANAFLDALAWHRHTMGLPAQSIDWGSWSEVGMAMVANRGQRLAAMGLAPLSPTEALQALGRALRERHPQVAIMRFNARKWATSNAGESTLIAELMGPEAAQASVSRGVVSIRLQLLATELGFRAPLLATHLRAELAKILQLSPEQLREDMSFRSMGMDSLTSLEFKNRLEATLGSRFSAATIWNNPTISKLVVHLAQVLGVPLVEGNEVVEDINSSDDDDLEGVLQGLSDEELAALAAEDLD